MPAETFDVLIVGAGACGSLAAKKLAERGFSKDPSSFLSSGTFSRDNTRLDDLQKMFEGVKAGI